MSPAELAVFLRREFPLVDRHPDVAGLLRRPDVLAALGPALAAPFEGRDVTVVLAPEARGPVLGALVARELGCGLMIARKEGRNHPGADVRSSGGTGWRGSVEVFQVRSFDLCPADRVLLVDDWMTTGSSLRALRSVVEEAGATLCGVAVVVDKAGPGTRTEFDTHALVGFDEIAGAVTRDR
jgi:adenine phosphoribosyltransferase